MHRNARRRVSVAMLTAALAAAILVGGCGSDDSSGGGQTAAATSKPRFSGAPIKIAALTTVDSPVGSFVQVFTGVKAAARAINAKGGIKGHELVVETCNGKLDPNQEVACARKAVRDGAVAMVGSFPIANGAGVQEVLAAAGMASVASGSTVPQAFDGTNTFPVDFLPGQGFTCANGALAEKATGTKDVRTLIGESPATKNVVSQYRAAAGHLGASLKAPIMVPGTQTDMSPIVQQASNRGNGLVSWFVAPTQSIAFITSAIAAGKHWAFCAADDGIAYDQRVKFGAALDNYYQSSSFPPLSAADKYPLLKAFIDQMKAEEEAGDSTAKSAVNYSRALRAWLGVQVVKQVAERMQGSITRETFLAAISKAKVDLGGVVPPLDFTKPRGGGDYRRVFNARTVKNKWDPAAKAFVEVPGLEIDAIDALGG